jgi:hypothetical protein
VWLVSVVVQARETIDSRGKRRLDDRAATTVNNAGIEQAIKPAHCSIRRAVSRPPSTATSATTTLAPSRAKASAVARPMPLVAPVMNATSPAKRAVWLMA